MKFVGIEDEEVDTAETVTSGGMTRKGAREAGDGGRIGGDIAVIASGRIPAAAGVSSPLSSDNSVRSTISL